MKEHCIEIKGITAKECFPKYPFEYPYTQICETDKFCISCDQHDVEDILEVLVNISVRSFETINSPAGKKLVVDALKHIKVIYTAKQSCQSVHSICFDIPFCMFIPLNCHEAEVKDVFTGVEHISVHSSSCRTIYISILIFSCPIFACSCECDKHYEYWYSNKKYNEKHEYCCNDCDNCQYYNKNCVSTKKTK